MGEVLRFDDYKRSALLGWAGAGKTFLFEIAGDTEALRSGGLERGALGRGKRFVLSGRARP